MAPKIHRLTWPGNIAEMFGKGDKAKYNSYAFSYCRANNPNMEIVTVNGKPQDPFEQGYILATYKPGYSPAEILERRKENKASKPKKGKR
jgi:hypothetical protein